jgi:DNA primase
VIPEEKIAEIRERTDIVALVQEYVPLKRVGASFKGLCPFHSEKTPSFYVHPARQFYHCFGCQASGDAIRFFMQVDGRSFPEAARLLAERAGVEIPALDAREEAEHKRARAYEERLVAIMDAAAGFYVHMLKSHPLASMAREELLRRGIRDETAKDFRLGYAPHGWDALARFLADKGHATEDAEKVGLLLERRSGGGHYDRFRHRLLFPITDMKGRIVAFSGRILDPPPDEPLESRTEPGAKYVNSPESPLYKKGEILFGLHEGRVAVRREGWLLVCEGNFDLLALHQAGFENAVAPMGTALTESHAKLIKRFADRAVLLFDGDRAGKKAVRAAAPLLAKANIAAKVVTLPPGDDPDTYLRAHGSEALRKLVDVAPGILEHLIDDAAADAGGDASEKAAAIGGLAPMLATVENPVERRLYVERVARKFGISDVSVVREQLNRALRMSRSERRRGEIERRPRREAPASPRRFEVPSLEGELFGAILDNPELFATTEAADLERLLTSEELRGIFRAAAGMVEARGVVDATALLDEVASNPAHGWLNGRLAVQKYEREAAERALRDGIPRLERKHKERQVLELNESIKAARRIGDEARAMDLTRRRDELRQGAYQATKR